MSDDRSAFIALAATRFAGAPATDTIFSAWVDTFILPGSPSIYALDGHRAAMLALHGWKEGVNAGGGGVGDDFQPKPSLEELQASLGAAAARSAEERAAEADKAGKMSNDAYDELVGRWGDVPVVGDWIKATGEAAGYAAKPLIYALAYGLTKVWRALSGGNNWNADEQAARALAAAKIIISARFSPSGMIPGLTDDWKHYGDAAEAQVRILDQMIAQSKGSTTWTDWQGLNGWIESHSTDPTVQDLASLGWWPMTVPQASTRQGAITIARLFAAWQGKDPTPVLTTVDKEFVKAYQAKADPVALWRTTMLAARYAVDHQEGSSTPIGSGNTSGSPSTGSGTPPSTSGPKGPVDPRTGLAITLDTSVLPPRSGTSRAGGGALTGGSTPSSAIAVLVALGLGIFVVARR